MAENSIPTNRSKIVSGIKYVYLLAFFALLAGVFHPFITDTSKENLVYGILILFIGLAGAILVYKGITSQRQLILTLSGLALMIISLFLIYQIADRPLLQI